MKIFSQVFLVGFVYLMINLICNLQNSLSQAENDYSALEQRSYQLSIMQDKLRTEYGVQHDYVEQLKINKDFIDQLVREKTGRLKSNEIIYKFEE